MTRLATPTRRGALGVLAGGLVAARLLAHGSAASCDAALRRALDGSDELSVPAARLAALEGFTAAGLSPSARLDLLTVRAGLGYDARLTALPAGSPDRYALELARACGAEITPGEAERRLTASSQRLENQARRLFERQGIWRGSLGQSFRSLLADPAQAYPDSEAGRDMAVADMNRWLDRARAALPRWFNALPPECLDVAVRRLTPEEIAAGKGGFRTLPKPGARGNYVVDLKDIARRPRWTLHTVVHHELLPGHMIQLPLQEAADPHPLRLHYTPGFAEGWASYAELLAWHGGLIDDPAAQLGAIHWQLFRILRGLADVLMHQQKWSAGRIEAMLGKWMGFPVYFAPFAADVDKIATTPGIRAAEALTLLALAAKARRAPDLQNFHTHVLAGGPLPIALI